MTRVMITTSRSPPRRTNSFVIDLVRSIPNSVKVMRGGKSMNDLLHEAEKREAKHILVIYSFDGNPSRIDYYDLTFHFREPRAMILLRGVSLSREIGVKERPVFNDLYYNALPKWAVKGFAFDLETILQAFGAKKVAREEMESFPKKKNKGIVSLRKSSTAYAFNMSFLELKSRQEIGPRIRVREVRHNVNALPISEHEEESIPQKKSDVIGVGESA